MSAQASHQAQLRRELKGKFTAANGAEGTQASKDAFIFLVNGLKLSRKQLSAALELLKVKEEVKAADSASHNFNKALLGYLRQTHQPMLLQTMDALFNRSINPEQISNAWEILGSITQEDPGLGKYIYAHVSKGFDHEKVLAPIAEDICRVVTGSENDVAKSAKAQIISHGLKLDPKFAERTLTLLNDKALIATASAEVKRQVQTQQINREGANQFKETQDEQRKAPWYRRLPIISHFWPYTPKPETTLTQCVKSAMSEPMSVQSNNDVSTSSRQPTSTWNRLKRSFGFVEVTTSSSNANAWHENIEKQRIAEKAKRVDSLRAKEAQRTSTPLKKSDPRQIAERRAQLEDKQSTRPETPQKKSAAEQQSERLAELKVKKKARPTTPKKNKSKVNNRDSLQAKISRRKETPTKNKSARAESLRAQSNNRLPTPTKNKKVSRAIFKDENSENQVNGPTAIVTDDGNGNKVVMDVTGTKLAAQVRQSYWQQPLSEPMGGKTNLDRPKSPNRQRTITVR